MSLEDPPASLEVRFDMHGVRCEVRPVVERPLFVQAMYAAVTAVAMLAGLAVALFGWAMALAGGSLVWLALMIPVGLWWLALAAYASFDREQQLERLQIRVGEGWLVIRHRIANLLQDPDVDVLELGERAVVTETERIDLTDCVECRVVRGPTLVVKRTRGLDVHIPMRAHTLEEIGWLAGAIDAGIRDARHGAPPAPPALLNLRDPLA